MFKWRSRVTTQKEVDHLISCGWDIATDGDPMMRGVACSVDDELAAMYPERYFLDPDYKSTEPEKALRV